MDPELEDAPSSINDNLYQFFMNRNTTSQVDAPTTSILSTDFHI